MIRFDGDSGLANTLPDYQKLGLYGFVGKNLMKQSYQAVQDNFGYATTVNKTQQHITIDKFGFKKVGDICHRFAEPKEAKLWSASFLFSILHRLL